MIRKDDLQRDGLILYQDTELPRFTADSVLLAHFLRLGPKDTCVDLGAGTGVLSVLGRALTGAAFTAVEKEPALTELLLKSEAENRQGLKCLTADVADAPALLGHGSYTACVTNPPYFDSGAPSPDAMRALARHADDSLLECFFKTAFLLLKNGGKLFLCCPPDRLASIFSLLIKNRLEPKRMRLSAASPEAAPRLALIEAKKLGKPGLVLEPLLFGDAPSGD